MNLNGNLNMRGTDLSGIDFTPVTSGRFDATKENKSNTPREEVGIPAEDVYVRDGITSGKFSCTDPNIQSVSRTDPNFTQRPDQDTGEIE